MTTTLRYRGLAAAAVATSLGISLLPLTTASVKAQTSSAPVATAQSQEQPAVRGDVRAQRLKFHVPTPKVSQQTVFHAVVKSSSKPTVSVRSAGGRGTVRTTAVGGVRKLNKARQYTVTVSALKPKVGKANSKAGQLRVTVKGKKLKLINQNTYTNAFTRKAKGAMCRAISAFDLPNRNPRARVKFQDKILFGNALRGFNRADYLGTFSVLRACTGKSVQSFNNAMLGKRQAAVKTKSPVTSLRTAQTRATSVPQAVVLVSGFMSQTPFTSPGATCSASGMSAGGTWSDMQTALANDGFPVFTAPATSYSYASSASDPTPVAISPSTMGLGTCANTQLPASMTINTAGDFDLNSSILASYLNYLNQQYGLTDVWLVGHSDGGLWSRGALDYASFMPNTSVVSITTIDTPWTGAFLANLAVDQAVATCPTLDLVCDAKEDALNSILNYFSSALDNGAALEEMTSTYMTGWNSRMAGVPGATPFYAASAIGLNDPDTFNTLVSGTGNNPFYNPNDVAVGISSQQADGLVANGTISNLACFATIPGLHTELPSSVITAGQDADLINTYPGSTTAVTTNPMNITNVTNVLNGNPPTTACPSANYQQSGEYAPGQYGPWPDNS